MNYTKQDLEDSIKHCSEKLLELDKSVVVIETMNYY